MHLPIAPYIGRLDTDPLLLTSVTVAEAIASKPVRQSLNSPIDVPLCKRENMRSSGKSFILAINSMRFPPACQALVGFVEKLVSYLELDKFTRLSHALDAGKSRKQFQFFV